VVGKDPVEFEKYLEKKFAVPEENMNTLISFTSTVTIVYYDTSL
jgi:hypothetical protein